MKSFKFDFSKGDFDVVDGKVTKITETELIKNKIEKLLRTAYERYPIYTVYGMPFHNWFYGQRDRELVQLAMTRELTERIPKLVEGVTRVYSIGFDFEHSGVNVSITVDSIYSNSEVINLWLTL